MYNLPPVFIGIDTDALRRNVENAALISLAITGGLNAAIMLEQRDFSMLDEEGLKNTVAAFERVIAVGYSMPNVAEA